MKKKRISSFCIDFGILTALLLLCNLFNIPAYVSSMLFVLFFLRDSIASQSPGRRIMGICVQCNGKPISPILAFVRNLFLMLWPVELVLFAVNGQRLGDVVAKSTCVECGKEPYKINYVGVIMLAVLWLLIVVLYFNNPHTDMLVLL